MLPFGLMSGFCVDLVALLALALWIPVSVVAAEEVQTVAPASVLDTIRTTVAKGIALLEKGDFEAFLREVYSPEFLSRLTQAHTIREAAEAMKENGDFSRTLSALKAATKVEARLYNDGKMAVFEFAEPVDGLKRIAFVRIGMRWYVF